MPQFKSGWLSFWKFYACDADVSGWMLERLISEKDPAKAASFCSMDDAWAFIDRVMKKADAYWQGRFDAKWREVNGVAIRRKISAR